MPKTLLVVTLVLLLAACSPEASGTPSLHLIPTVTPTSPSMPCLVVNRAAMQEPALAIEFGDRGHVLGPADAPVTIVVFSDYQCSSCAFLAAIMKQLREAHPDDLRIVYLHWPRSGLDKDGLAIQAAEAADLQGKFWEMHELLFMKQAEWIDLAPAEFEAWVEDQAAGLGLRRDQFRTDLHGPIVAERAAQAAASSAGAQPFALPRIFVNSNLPYSGMVDFPNLDQVVRLSALTARQFNACPPLVINPLKQYNATLLTRKGEIVLQLYAEKAPLAVNNFVFLARSSWFNGITFHRVLPGLLVQSGDPSGTGLGNPGYYFANETAPGVQFDRPGVVAMLNTGMDTNGSQFIITLAAAPQLDGRYTIFGQVIRGMDVLAALTARDPLPGQALPPGDELISVTIQER